jgi:hypothetical protein
MLIERSDLLSPYGPGLPPVLGSQAWDLTLSTELYGFDDLTDATSSSLAALFAASGYLRSDGLGSVTWDHAAAYSLVGAGAGAGVVPATIQIDRPDGNAITLYDCVATWAVDAPSGARPRITWTIQGRWNGDPSASSLSSPLSVGDVVWSGGTFADPLPWINEGASLAVPTSGTLEGLASWALNPGVSLVERVDAQDARGFAPSYLSQAEPPTMAIVLDALAEGTLDAWTDALAAGTGPLILSIPNGAQVLTMSMPAAYSRIPESQGDAVAQYAITYAGAVDSTVSATALSLVWA